MMGTRESRLRSLVDFQDEITLVPSSGIQFLDFGFDMNKVDLKPAKFVERTDGETDGVPERSLRPLSGDAERDAEILSAMQKDDEEYSIRPVAALEPYLAKWVPVPVLRLKSQRGPSGEERYAPGPSSWARLRTVELDEPDPETGHTHRVQLALDTTLMAGEQGDHYLAPDHGDAEKQREFRLVSDPYDMDWFLRRLETGEDGNVIDLQQWVSDWLKEVFIDFKRAQNPTRLFSEDKLPYLFEHWARYLAYLNLIQKVVTPPKMRFVNSVSERDAVVPVDVDLVLDVGNSRTCGILIENFPGESRVDLARSYQLAIRDLSQPEFYYSGLFPSRAEFAELKFGNEQFASRSGRRNAFLWPSFVRIGPEAVRLTQGEAGTETVSGLSSPKRYLWDDAASKQDWRFQNHDDPNNLPKSVRAAMRHLNEAGDVIAQVEYEEDQRLRKRGQTSTQRAIRPRFSRSSMFGFAMAEIIAHALVQINDPALRSRRAQSDLPRRLKRVILSMPTATSAQEQAIIRSRTEGALKLVCDVMGMSEAARPRSYVDWDEASCTQLVYLYSEVTQKFDGRIDTFLKLKGHERPNAKGVPEPSLRLACIDIGGGTTDLMITTYRGEANRVLHPEQTFREGFRVAGDDLVQRVISAIILPKLQSSIEAAGGRYVGEKLRELFGGDLGGQDQQSVQRRRQFAIRVLVPLAEAMIEHCEKSDEFERFALPVADILGVRAPDTDDTPAPDDDEAPPPPVELSVSDGILSYIEDAALAVGAQDWRLADVTLSTDRQEVDAVSREVFQKVLGNLCEVIDHLGVDMVLLTGRPSRLPAVRSIVEEMLVVPAYRLISMHTYKTGRWYPFRDPITQRIGDPKSTVAVGGMLIALSENRIPNFKVFTGAFQMRSTARFIGEMDSNGQIVADKVLFSGLDADQQGGGETAMVNVFSPVHIGSRQLGLERWTTTPLYRLDFANTNPHSRPAPIRVELVRTEFDDDDERQDTEAKLRRAAMQEAFEIGEVTDGDGDAMKLSDMVLSLHTLGCDDDYWLDAGVFRF